MLYPLASTLFPTLACESSKHSACKCATYVYVRASNASNTEFRLSIALGNKMDMASLIVLHSK